MARIWVRNSALGTIFSHFYHRYRIGFHDQDPEQAACCVIVESTTCMYMQLHSLYVIVSITELMVINHLQD